MRLHPEPYNTFGCISVLGPCAELLNLNLHWTTCRFALPALLPLISSDMQLTDAQGSLLTAGYTVGSAANPLTCLGTCSQSYITTAETLAQVLYALALVPVGFLADKADRPRLLAGGLVVWSVLTMVASKASLCPCIPCLFEGVQHNLLSRRHSHLYDCSPVTPRLPYSIYIYSRSASDQSIGACNR